MNKKIFLMIALSIVSSQVFFIKHSRSQGKLAKVGVPRAKSPAKPAGSAQRAAQRAADQAKQAEAGRKLDQAKKLNYVKPAQFAPAVEFNKMADQLKRPEMKVDPTIRR